MKFFGRRTKEVEADRVADDSEETRKLKADLEADEYETRAAATRALDEMGWQPDNGEAGAAYWIQKRKLDKCVEIGAPAVPALIASMERPEIMQDHAAEALGRIGDARAVKALTIALEHEWGHVRSAAAEALGEIGHKEAIETLSLALEDEDRRTRLKVAVALDKIGWRPDENRTGALYWTVKYLSARSNSEESRQAAAEALKRTGWQPDESEVGAAYWVTRRRWDECVEIGAPAVIPLFVSLQHAESSVREASSDALVRIGKPAVDALISALGEEERWSHTDASSMVLRINAATVLGRIGDPRAMEALIGMFNQVERSLDHKKAAADALAMIGEPCVERLIAALTDKKVQDHQGVAWALGQIGDERAVESLITILSPQPFNPPHERAAAAKALKEISGQNFGEDARRWKEWWSGFAQGCGPHSDRVEAVAVTPDGRMAVTGSLDKTLKVWNLETGEIVTTHTGPVEKIRAVTVTDDGQKILFGTDGREVRINPLQLGEVDAKVKLWELKSGKELKSYDGHDEKVTAVAVMPDGRRAVSCAGDKTIKIWDLESGEELATLRGHEKPVFSVAVTPDGQRVISGSGDQSLKVWDPASGEELATLRGHDGRVFSVAVTVDGKRIISGSEDKTMKMWDVETGEEVATLTGHEGAINAVALTPDGQHAVSASSDKTLKIWDLSNRVERSTLRGHLEEVSDVAVTPDGRHVVSASADHTVRVWGIKDGEEIRTLTGRKEEKK